MYSYWN